MLDEDGFQVSQVSAERDVGRVLIVIRVMPERERPVIAARGCYCLQ